MDWSKIGKFLVDNQDNIQKVAKGVNVLIKMHQNGSEGVSKEKNSGNVGKCANSDFYGSNKRQSQKAKMKNRYVDPKILDPVKLEKDRLKAMELAHKYPNRKYYYYDNEGQLKYYIFSK